MTDDLADLAAEVTNHLSEILAGRCGLSLAQIAETDDSARAEVLAGLFFLHEDLAFQRAQTRDAQAERDAIATAALQRSEQRLDLLMTQFCGIMWTTDDELRVCSAVHRGQDGADLSSEVTEGTELHGALGAADPLLLACRRATRGDASTFDWRWRGRIYQTHVAPYAWSRGDDLGSAVVAFDVTELRQLELRTQEAARLEAMGQLAGGVAHDFNNLLTIIKSYAHLVQEAVAHDPESEEDVGQILLATDRAATLVEQLLAFGRRQFRSPEVVDLSVVVQDFVVMLRRVLREDIELVHVLGDDCGRVHVDRSQLEQVLMNLAVNAREAMPSGGTLSIETRGLVLSEDSDLDPFGLRPGVYAVIAISDTGVGMDEATRTRVFEPFFSTKADAGGTGLGLATTYGIIRQSGGNITVYSEPGQGTTFKVYLPTTDATTVAPRRPADKNSDIPQVPLSIVFVDDEEGLRTAAARILRSAGHAVAIASGPVEALAMMDRWPAPPDLLITDVVMAGMNGRQLAEKLCERWPSLPVLFISGYSENVIVKQGVLIEGARMLTKPFTPDELHHMIAAVVAAHGKADERR